MSDGDSIRVDRIVRRKKGRPGEELEVHLSDASSFFVALRVWEDKPFHEDDLLSPERIEAMQNASEVIVVRSRALGLLSRAEHTRFLLSQKLRSRDMGLQAIEVVLDELEATGALSDERYASSWVRDRIRRHPEGRSVLIAGLRQRGVSSAIAEDAVQETLNEDGSSPEDLARALATRLFRNKRLDARAVAVRMYHRGFSHSLVARVLNDLTDDGDELLAE